jgi:hypothetical protein
MRLSEAHLDDIEANVGVVSAYTRALISELRELRALRDAVLDLADAILDEVCEYAPDTKLADAIATERARAKEGT